jgi:hypothetical protein
MTPNARFTEFLADIEPSSTTKSNASTAHSKLRATLSNDATFGPLHRHTFLSGSFKRDTAIRPLVKNGNAQRPDVDIIVVTTHDTFDDPVEVVDAVHAALTRHHTPTNRQARSVSVSSTLADMDVVPLIDPTDDGTYYIADRLQRQWLRTNPPGHTAWTTRVNDAVGGRFKRLVKLFKWWRRQNKTVGKRPKGFILEVLAAENMSLSETHYGKLFVQMLESIVDRYHSEVSLGIVPELEDPSMPGNNILSGLSFAAFESFYNKVKAHAAIGRKALAIDDQDKATEKWRILFGERFPKPPVRKSTGLLETATTSSGLVFPDHPVRPANKPAGFA